MDSLIKGVFVMAVYSVCSTRMASAATAVPKPATATFIVVSNGNTDEGYFQETSSDLVDNTYTAKALGNEHRMCKKYTDSCVLPGYYAARSGTSLPPSTNVGKNYRFSLRNNPELRN